MSWQKPARIGVAVIGLAFAGAVYLMMGERRAAPPPQPILRHDPKAILEIAGSVIHQFAGSTKNFEVLGKLTGYYEDGTKKITGDPLTIIVHKGESRTVQITAAEAKVSKDENYFELKGPVKLRDSDGFWLETDTATVSRADSIAHVPGAATFGKGRMSGSGVGLSYDEMRQVLLISQQVQIKTVDEAGKPVMQMSAGSGMLDRLQHILTLDSKVHVVRDMEVIDTDLANGRLSANNDVVTYVELHGNSRVTGGPSIDVMNARDISLDYTEDGKSLEAIKTIGAPVVAMKGDSGRPGRRITADDTVDLTLAADGTLTSAAARNNVRMDLPPAADTPARTITSQALDGTGQPGKGLTSATFTRDVAFTEQTLPSRPGAVDKTGQRTARAQKLEASMANDAVTAATFTGDVTFEETGLKGCAARVEYQPQRDSLTLSEATKGGNPIVAQEQVAIEGQAIDVMLETRRMEAKGEVRAFIHAPAMQRCRPAQERATAEQGANNVPRLLKTDAPVTISARSLAYDSQSGHAVYSGGAMLRQDDTSITGERVTIDQSKGDLSATGNATSTLILDNKISRGRAHEIRYSDDRRQISFASAPKASAVPASNTTAGQVSLAGSESTLQAGSIDLMLAAKENTLERMTALRNVRMTEGTHTVTGAATLDYRAEDQQYVVTSDGTTRVVVVTRDNGNCRQDSGNSITFFKGNSRIIIDGQQRNNTSTGPSKSACSPSTR